MHYVAHLILPAVLLMAMLLIGMFGENKSFIGAIERMPMLYAMLAFPHWVWAGISAYFETSFKITNGGFIGASGLLVGVALWIAQSHEPESANGWILYLVLSPLAIGVSAMFARWAPLKRGEHA